MAPGRPRLNGVRAEMTASWLAQMGWDVWVVDGIAPAHFSERGALPTIQPPPVATVSPAQLATWSAQEDTLVLDVGPSSALERGHVPGAWWCLRSQLPQLLRSLPPYRRLVLTCPDGVLSSFAVNDLTPEVNALVFPR